MLTIIQELFFLLKMWNIFYNRFLFYYYFTMYFSISKVICVCFQSWMLSIFWLQNAIHDTITIYISIVNYTNHLSHILNQTVEDVVDEWYNCKTIQYTINNRIKLHFYSCILLHFPLSTKFSFFLHFIW